MAHRCGTTRVPLACRWLTNHGSIFIALPTVLVAERLGLADHDAGDQSRIQRAGGSVRLKYTDPFGLCPIENDGIPCAAEYLPGVSVGSERLRGALDAIAAEANVALVVYGGDRSPESNEAVGGAAKSSHLSGEAADVIFKGKSKKETVNLLLDSKARKANGVRLLYHQRGSTLPEHSHLDLQSGGDITEQKKGANPKHVPLTGPVE